MQDFFRKHGVAVMTIRELFDFIVDTSITEDSLDSYLEEVVYFPTSHWLILQRDLYPKPYCFSCSSLLVSGSTKDFGKRRCDFTGR